MERVVIILDVNGIMQLVTSLGFPIVACGAMGYYVKYITDKHREEVTTLNEQHRTEMTEVTKAINNNTLALQQLTDFITAQRGISDDGK